MIDNPMLTGKQYRDDELGDAAVQRANWRYATFGAIGVAVLAILCLFYALSLPRRILVPVLVDRDSGDVRIVQETTQTLVPPEKVYLKQLWDAVVTLRKVPQDKEDMRRAHVAIRAQMTEQGKKQYTALEVDKRLEFKNPVTIDTIGRPLHDGGLTWDVRWRETTYGTPLTIETWRGKFTFVRVDKMTQEEEDASPLHIQLESWSWGKE